MKSELALENWTDGNIDPRSHRELGAGLTVDCFCGGGGTSEGFVLATGKDPDIAINHDEPAIVMHKANHPGTKHFRQSIYAIDPLEATQGRPVDVAWFSPDCTHFSKAKGGKPVKKNIRDLADVVHHWIDRLGPARRPLLIMLENVWEFTKWGPLMMREDGKEYPDPERHGEFFDKWVSRLRRAGYKVEWKALKACDYGAPTSRTRLLLVARCDRQQIVWPEPSHGPGTANPYRTAAECIDWSIPCPSIFDRKRPLVDSTCRRIAVGIQRFVIDAEKPFIVPLTHHGSDNRVYDVDKPIPTVTGANRGEMAVISPSLVQVTHTKNNPTASSVEKPLKTITTAKGGEFAVVSAMLDRQFGNSEGADVAEPMGSVMAGGGGKTALVTAFMAQHNTGATGHPVSDPLSTIVHRGTQQQLVTSNLIKLRGTGMANPVDKPLHTISAQGLHHAEVRAFMFKYYNDKGQYANPADPMHTVTVKDRMGLVMVTIGGEPYVITDIGMRMLSSRELFNAQGFRPDYIIDPEYNGKPMTKTAQVAKCGNSVPPQWPDALLRANAPQLCVPRKIAA